MSEAPHSGADERDEAPAAVEEQEAMRGPLHEDPDAARTEVGLGGGHGRRGEPDGAPLPDEVDRGAPTPSSDEQTR